MTTTRSTSSCFTGVANSARPDRGKEGHIQRKPSTSACSCLSESRRKTIWPHDGVCELRRGGLRVSHRLSTHEYYLATPNADAGFMWQQWLSWRLQITVLTTKTAKFFTQYQSDFEQVHSDWLPAGQENRLALDIGAGSGRDALALAERGWGCGGGAGGGVASAW